MAQEKYTGSATTADRLLELIPRGELDAESSGAIYLIERSTGHRQFVTVEAVRDAYLRSPEVQAAVERNTKVWEVMQRHVGDYEPAETSLQCDIDAAIERGLTRYMPVVRGLTAQLEDSLELRGGVASDVDQLEERVLSVLSSTTQAVLSDLPRSLRAAGSALFRLDFTEGGSDAVGFWEDGLKRSLRLRPLIVDRAGFSADFDRVTGGAFADIVLQAIGEAPPETNILPGLPVFESKFPTVWLQWREAGLSV
jgi:hypothetical protein